MNIYNKLIKKKVLDWIVKPNLRIIIFEFSAVLTLVFLFTVSVVSYRSSSVLVLQTIEKIDAGTLRQLNNKLNYSILETEKLIKRIKGNETFKQYYEKYDGSIDGSYQKEQAQFQLSSLLRDFMVDYDNIYSIEFITGENYISTLPISSSLFKSEINMEQLYSKIDGTGDITHIFKRKDLENIASINYKGMVFGSTVTINGRKAGALLVIMQANWIESLFEKYGNIIVYDKSDSSIILSDTSELSNSNSSLSRYLKGSSGFFRAKFAKEEYKVSYTNLNHGSWYILFLKKFSDIAGQMNQTRKITFISALVILLLGFMVSGFLSNKITRPVYDLISAIKKYRSTGKPDFNLKINRYTNIKLIIALFLTGVVTLSVFVYNVYFYITFLDITGKSFKDSLSITVSQTVDNIDIFAKTNERVFKSIMIDSNIQNYLIGRIKGKIINTQVIFNRYLGKAVEDIMSTGDNIFDITIFERDGKIAFSTSYFNAGEGISGLDKNIINKSGYASWIFYGKDKYNRNIIKFIRQIRGYIINEIENQELSLKKLGYLSLIYYENDIEAFYNDINIGNNNAYIILDSGKIISSRNKTSIGQYSAYKDSSLISPDIRTRNINGVKSLVIRHRFSNLPWILVYEIPYAEMLKEVQQVLNVNIYLLIATIILMAVISYCVSGFIIKPFKELCMRLERFSNGEAGIDFTIFSSTNEIAELADTLNSMAYKIEALIYDIYQSKLKENELENARKISDLIALQAQINPHFLYNALDSISWMIRKDKKDNAIEMVSALAELFRLGVRYTNNFITIKEEIECANTYVGIQKLRLGSKLTLRWDIDSSLLSNYTPKLVLQPLIENAIHHGIQEKPGGGIVNINCFSDNDNIYFTVTDDGAGIEASYLKEISDTLDSDLPGSSIGIFNVQKRLRLYFGKDYGISIMSHAGTGTVVSISIPKINGSNLYIYENRPPLADLS